MIPANDLESNSDLFNELSSRGTEKDTLCMQSIINGLESCYDQTWAPQKISEKPDPLED